MSSTGFTGKQAYIKFGDTELDSYYRSAGWSEEIDLVEETAGSDDNKTYLTAVLDGTSDLELIMPSGTAGTAVWAAVKPGTEGTLEVGPEGTASGKPKHTVNAIVKSRGKPLTYNDITTFSVSFQFSGAVTDSTYA